ncbi:MAG: hypothetical protein AAGD32_02180 [Planctomycetota bacterium]
MPLSENEFDLLEQYLDGESDEAQAAHVRALIASRDDAAEALRAAKARRGLRSEIFQQQGEDDEQAIDRILAAIRAEGIREKFAQEDKTGFGWRQWTGLAAACLALGLFGVFIGYATGPGGNAPATITAPNTFNVQVVNDAGQVTETFVTDNYPEARSLADEHHNARILTNGYEVQKSAGL